MASSMIDMMKEYFSVIQQKARLTSATTKDLEKLLRV